MTFSQEDLESFREMMEEAIAICDMRRHVSPDVLTEVIDLWIGVLFDTFPIKVKATKAQVRQVKNSGQDRPFIDFYTRGRNYRIEDFRQVLRDFYPTWDEVKFIPWDAVRLMISACVMRLAIEKMKNWNKFAQYGDYIQQQS